MSVFVITNRAQLIADYAHFEWLEAEIISALTTLLASRNSLVHIPPGKERCSCGLLDANLSIYKNNFLFVPFLSMNATSADSPHMCFQFLQPLYGLQLVEIQKELDVDLHLLHMNDDDDDDPMLVGLVDLHTISLLHPSLHAIISITPGLLRRHSNPKTAVAQQYSSLRLWIFV